ncbi:MAG: Electron transfer flavoprotein-ubiquinone oxidoreductase [Candidatus Heimdallarchaeota archaeon LC_3]|nr:MAG: Electron transfer flavoprotein-ubiquinone oxidoreductase [Candidatus Heimdallarchaeota archaeon LC_3]
MDYDVIVIGAGVAGSATAIHAANKGLDVLLLDRGDPIGSKNLSGGVLWGNDLGTLLGDNWWEEAPVERYIVNKGIGLLAPEDSMFVNLNFPSWKKPPYNGFSVLRAHFDPWLAEKAKEAGADVFNSVNVDELIIKDGKVCGIRQSGDEFTSNVVVFAEGANPQLAIKYGFRNELDPKKDVQKHFMLGIKEIISLPQETIEQRFNVGAGEGMAYEMLAGCYRPPNDQARVGAFLYTNKESLSIGIVVQLETITRKSQSELGIHTYTLWEQFKKHPFISKLIEDGETVEYGAKMVPHGGIHMIPKKLFFNGALLVGDAAGFVFSNGLTINGMNYGICSGILAADALIEAKSKNDFTSRGLSIYGKKIKSSYFYKTMKKFKKVDKYLTNPRLFNRYAEVLTGGLKDMLTENQEVKQKAISAMINNLKKQKVNRFRAALDALSLRHL